MSLFAELVEEGEDAEGLVHVEDLGHEVTLQDLEEALAELAAQNEQLEVDCRGLEAHCRDLERAGWPVPCKLADVIRASETVEEVEPAQGQGGQGEPDAVSEHMSIVLAAEAALKASEAGGSAVQAAEVGKALASASSGVEPGRFHELALPVISRAISAVFCDDGDAPSAARAAANAAVTAGLQADAAAAAGFVAAGMVAGKHALRNGKDMKHAAELGWKTAMELAQAGGLSKDAATQVAAQAASEIASEASRSAGKICERVVEDAAEAAKRAAKASPSLSTRLGVEAAGRAAVSTVALQAPALDALQIVKHASGAIAAITREAMPGAEEELVKEVHRATSRVMEEAMNVVIAKASHSKEAVLVQSPEVSPNVPNQQNDQEDRVKELMKAREKSFAAMADMQERCACQQTEMERLVRERAGDQEELLKLRQQLRNMEQQLQEAEAREQLREGDHMDSLSATTGDDTSSLADSLAGSVRRMRKKRNARAGQNFRQAKCLDEGVDVSTTEGDADPEERLIRILVAKSHASPLWRDLLIFILEKAGHASTAPMTTEAEIKKELQLMAYQVKDKLGSLEGTTPSQEGMLETMLKTVGKVTDQAVDSAVLYVTQDSPAPEASSRDPEVVVKEAFAPERVDPAQAGADAFKQNARLRLAARRNRQRGSVLSVAASVSSKPGG
ncbi:hypothetical protein AK812_SmicGene15516 [Symbiodinium microadriaticum]|uniref:Uncharacterized protein n=1 Tax=Symbiodinium microadriaticum TaxID=2951 RepID=A0A1Q9E2Q1_SYMMI|nr:hypothetical protein AK812_SmicGene15516 [Symbiodinium microadriaticum]CAE6947776.1 unnamed protein product [Symbiodinium sp. KB8]CAE7855371.1 unnamed protein product [Symbiodinium microadriaticum]